MNETPTAVAESSIDAETQAVLAEIDASEAAAAAPKASKSTQAEPANRGAEEKSDEQQLENGSAPEKGADDKSDTPAAKADETQKTQELSKSDKDRQRLDKTWEKVNEEKDRLAREREELARERDEINRSKPKEHTPDDFKNAADRWDTQAKELEDAGRFSESAEKRALAKEARAHAENLAKEIAARPKTPATLTPSKERMENDKLVAASWEKAKATYPDILAPGSPHNSEFRNFMQANPDVLNHPKGPELVAEHVSLKLQAARVPDLQKQVESQAAKIRSLEALASPAPGGVARSTETKSFADLSSKEQERLLEAELG